MNNVEKVKSGKLWIANDNVEYLRKCLRYCFPHDASLIGTWSYYMALSINNTLWFGSSGLPKNPTIKASKLWKEIELLDLIDMAETALIEYREKKRKEEMAVFPFKKGSWVTVNKPPFGWSSYICNKSPYNVYCGEDYPLTFELQGFAFSNGVTQWSMKMGDCGWCYDPEVMRPATQEEINKAKRQESLPKGWKEEELETATNIRGCIRNDIWGEFGDKAVILDGFDFALIKDSPGTTLLIARRKP